MRVSASDYVQNDNVDVTFLKVREESKVKPRSFVVEFGTKKWQMHAFLPTFELLFSSPLKVRVDLLTGVTLLSHTLIHKHMHTQTLWSEGWFVQFVGISPCIAAGGSPASTLQRKKKKFLYFFFLSLLELHKSCPLGLEVLHTHFFLPRLLVFLLPSPPPATLNSPVVRCPVILSQPGHQAFSIGLLEGLGLIHQTAPLCTFITCSLCCCEHVACSL